jgi:hypothetical protein
MFIGYRILAESLAACGSAGKPVDETHVEILLSTWSDVILVSFDFIITCWAMLTMLCNSKGNGVEGEEQQALQILSHLSTRFCLQLCKTLLSHINQSK